MRGMLVSTLMLCQTMSTTGAAESEFKALKCGYTSERCICEERCKCEDLRQSNSATEQCHCEKTECRCEQTGLLRMAVQFPLPRRVCSYAQLCKRLCNGRLHYC